MGYINSCIIRNKFRIIRNLLCSLLSASFYSVVLLLAVNPANAQETRLIFNTTEPGQSTTQSATISYSRTEKITEVVLCEDTCSSEFTRPNIGPNQTMELADGAQWTFSLVSESCLIPSGTEGCQNTYSITFTAPSIVTDGPVDNQYRAQLRASKTDGEQTLLAGSIPLVANYNNVNTQANPSLVEFGSQTISGKEGAAINIPVIRSELITASQSEFVSKIAGPLQARVFLIDSQNTTATSNLDFIYAEQIISWGAEEEGSKNVQISLLDDTIADDGEVLFLGVEVVEGDGFIGQFSTIEVIIIDEPPQTGILRFTEAATTVTEDAGFVELNVERVNGSTGELSIILATQDSTANAGQDYTRTIETLTWDGGESSAKSIRVPIIDDQISGEGNEQFAVTMSAADGTPASVIGNPSLHTVTITDIEPPPSGTIQFRQATGTVAEDAGTVAVTIQRVEGSAGALTVFVATKNATALAGSDYTSVSRELSWANGITAAQTINIPIISDTDPESTEQFIVDLTAAEGTPASAIGTPAAQTISISNVDPEPSGTIQFSKSVESVAENDGTVLVSMERMGGSAGELTVAATTRNLTAIAGEDYISVSQSFTWASGETTAKQFSIDILEDAISDPDEQFVVSLSADTPSNIGTPANLTVTISDFTPPPAGRLQFSESNISINEDSGNVEIAVERVGGTAGTLSANISTLEVTAVDGEDYLGGAPQTLTWDAGETRAQIVRIPIINDGVVESAEQFTATLTPINGTPADGIGSPATITVTINNVQPPATGTIRFRTASQRVSEDAGLVNITVERTGGSAGELAVSVISADDSAVNGSDYVGLAQTLSLTWLDGDTNAKQFSIPILKTSEIENDESFVVSLVASEAGTLSEPDTHIVTISDVASTGTFSFATATIVAEETAGMISVIVERNNGSDGAVSVDYATQSNSASAGEDFIAASGTLNWRDGETAAKSFQLELITDNFNEVQEQLFVVLSNSAPVGDSTQLGNPSKLTINIAANGTPSPGSVSFSSSSLSTAESSGSVDFMVTRSGGDSGALSISVITRDGTATAGADYAALNTVLTWADGETGAQPVSVTIIEDQLFESNETFSVLLSSENSQATGVIDSLDITIENNDQAPAEQLNAGTLSLSSIAFQVSESDGSLEIDVIRSNGSSGAISVEYALEDGSAIGGVDFTEINGVLAWADGQTGAQTISIPLLEDDIEEADETFSLQLFNETAPPNHTLIIASKTATIEIIDSTETGTIRLLESTLTVDENDGIVSVSAERIDGSDGAITVNVSVSGISAQVGIDFALPAASLSWPSGVAGVKSIEIPILRDQLIEGDESFSVSLDPGTSNAVIDPEASETTVVIEDASPPLDSQFDLIILSGDGQLVTPGDTLEPLVLAVRSNTENVQLQPSVNVRWRVEPVGAANLLEGDFTVSDENGESSNRIEVVATGFIRIIATAFEDTEETTVVAGDSRIDPPPLNLVQGQVAFTIRAGLEGIPGLSLNQSKTAAALDDVCATLSIAQQSSEVLTPAQEDLLQTCQALDQTATITADLDRLAHEELFVIADSIVDTADIQTTNIYSRINALRSNQYDRLDLKDLQLQIYDQVIPGSVLDAAQNALTQSNTDDDNEPKSNKSGKIRAGSGFFSRLGFFFNGALSSGEVDGDGIQQDADVTTSGITFGTDYRVSDNFVVGAGIGIVQNETEFSSSRGGASIDGASLSLFSTWYESDEGYLDMIVDIGQNSYKLERQINLNGSATDLMALGETDATVLAFSVSAGRNFNKNGFEFGPYLRLSLISATVDAYNERTTANVPGFGSALSIQSHDVRSTSLSVGGQMSKSISTSFGVLLPQIRLEYESENETRKNGITASFLADPNDTAFTVNGTARDESYTNLGLGSSVLFKNGKSGFLFYETRAQHDFVTQHWLKLGFRMEF